MKKIIALALCLMGFAVGSVFAEQNSYTLAPFNVQWSSAALSIYIVGGATTTAATYRIHASSMSLTTADGLYPGTTQFVFTDTNKDTLAELVSYINAVSTTTRGAEGGVVASVINGAYDGNTTSELEIVNTAVSCFRASAAKTLYIDRNFGISYTLPVSRLYRGYQYHITGLTANSTYSSGAVYLNIYDGTSASSTKLMQYKLNATTVETPIILPCGGDLANSADTAMRFDVIGSSWVTAGYLNVIGYKK